MNTCKMYKTFYLEYYEYNSYFIHNFSYFAVIKKNIDRRNVQLTKIIYNIFF